MAKLTVAIWTPVSAPGESYVTFNPDADMTSYGYVFVDKQELDFVDMTREQLLPLAIETLHVKQADIRAKAESECKRIDETIQSLLAIGNDG